MGRLVNTADINNVLMYEKSNYGIFATEIDHIISGIISKCPTIEQEPVPIFDKIRAEIKTKCDSIPWRNNDYDDGWIEALEWVFDDVLDKYKAESEEV